MLEQKLPESIGPYQVIKSLGKGGMGEVFLVFDPHCQRKIALKKILPELCSHPIIKERFLREAKFAASLSHPCIIPIFHIEEKGEVFYTMAYIEGETLKEIFKSTLIKEKQGLTPHEIGISIPALTRVFLSVCQAIAYAYSKGFLHRDLKPENIMVGKYGEVFLLDWGIATHLDDDLDDDVTFESKEVDHNLTRPGKVLGTVNFMSPERALKEPANIQSEIYSLGVILYQILTLKLPFLRKDLKHFRKILKYESLDPPEDVAPYRDIPKQLSLIAQKCLSPKLDERYQTIHDLIFDLQNYIEGKPEWVLASRLNIMRKEDWEFQENILLSPQMAISNLLDSLVWMGLMLSKKPFCGNIKLEFELSLPDTHEGLGILICVPDPLDRKGLEDGYSLWIGGFADNRMNLFRAGSEIGSTPDHGIKPYQKSMICIEKIDHSLLVFVDGVLKLHYISHLPIVGNHVGILYKNPDFHMSEISLFTGSHAVMINCLSIPDAFFSSKNFEQAFTDYKKIAKSFEGRTEGREAQFRSGLSLVEMGKREKVKSKREELFNQASQEFERLKNTSGAPLEYLGKSLIYAYLDDVEEEIKCLELSLRKYAGHPLLSVIKEQVIFRVHETSKQNRLYAYQFLLLCLRHLPELFSVPSHHKLLENLVGNWTLPPFIPSYKIESQKENYPLIAIILAFWLNKPSVLIDMAKSLESKEDDQIKLLFYIFFALIYLKKENLAKELYDHRLEVIDSKLYQNIFILLLDGRIKKEDLIRAQDLIPQALLCGVMDLYFEKNKDQASYDFFPLTSTATTFLKMALYQGDDPLFIRVYRDMSEEEKKPGTLPNFLHLLFEIKNDPQNREKAHIEKSKEECFYYEKIDFLKKQELFFKITNQESKMKECQKKILSLEEVQKRD